MRPEQCLCQNQIGFILRVRSSRALVEKLSSVKLRLEANGGVFSERRQPPPSLHSSDTILARRLKTRNIEIVKMMLPKDERVPRMTSITNAGFVFELSQL